MPTGNNKNKRTSSGNTKNPGSKNSKSDAGLANSMPAVPKARDRAKEMDFKRRGDAESNEL
ncbi:MAG: hypothetical protein JWO92_1718 [Chitinophagaceae bacterium]|nr:hypothetical protein [Chitinophagaceae bacterium]MDB5222129.1 hypothetical protein [Chitinophagaceae bacterium]